MKGAYCFQDFFMYVGAKEHTFLPKILHFLCESSFWNNYIDFYQFYGVKC